MFLISGKISVLNNNSSSYPFSYPNQDSSEVLNDSVSNFEILKNTKKFLLWLALKSLLWIKDSP